MSTFSFDDVEALLKIGGGIALIGGAIAGVIGIKSIATSARDTAKEAKAMAISALDKINDFQTEAGKNFASADSVKVLTDRVDRGFHEMRHELREDLSGMRTEIRDGQKTVTDLLGKIINRNN